MITTKELATVIKDGLQKMVNEIYLLIEQDQKDGGIVEQQGLKENDDPSTFFPIKLTKTKCDDPDCKINHILQNECLKHNLKYRTSAISGEKFCVECELEKAAKKKEKLCIFCDGVLDNLDTDDVQHHLNGSCTQGD